MPDNLVIVYTKDWVEKSFINKLRLSTVNVTNSLTGRPPFSPIMVEDLGNGISLFEMAKFAGFSDPSMEKILSYHDSRVKLQGRLMIASLPFLFITYLLFTDMVKDRLDRIDSSTLAILVLFMPLFLNFAVLVTQGFLNILISRFYAESLCIRTILELIVELKMGEEVLANSKRRKAIISRVNYLAKMTLLLPSRYASKSETNLIWSAKHFKRLELYIRERERWIIAPTKTTLYDLEVDFSALAPIYIFGNYGQFVWPTLEDSIDKTNSHWLNRLFTGLPRFLGLSFPFLLLGVFWWRPGLYSSIPLENNVKTIILTAWLLLALDVGLKSGVVSQLVSLAKGIRELK